eukprot:COSAG01_NODE_4134_length_5316_cov_6.930255_5_plen_65_part_00
MGLTWVPVRACARGLHTQVGEQPSAGLPAGRPPMTKAQIVEPFERSFATSDPAEGGCPDWHPPP